MRAVLWFFSVLLMWSCAGAYRPVIIFHGIFSSSVYMDDLVQLIKDSHSGTEVHDIDGYDDLDSLVPMWDQVDGIKEKMLPIMQNATDGVNLICFSQGGLVCRGILETTPNHNVHTFVSLSSPQAGQFGDSVYLNDIFPSYTKDYFYELFYTHFGQDISIANYWRDPHHQDLYQKYSRFLYGINHPNGNSCEADSEHSCSQDEGSRYKENFEQIHDLVMIGGPDDGVITPWQSSHFAFCDENETIVEMKNQEYYLNDTFGLKTIDSRGGVHIHAIPGVHHTQWHGNKSVFDCCVAPYLN